ncbi:MAG: protein kinase, partial [Myxococcota bacterium]
LILGETLGVGAMGIVRRARQGNVGREVAVKSLREDTASDEAARRLLQEAWTTGALEHPNVVPLYDIDVDAEGRPQVVLKRIAGQEWSELIDRPEAIRSRHESRDPLEFNLRILLQVCRAVHFAHRRGFVHRDLKPENVMVGEFGEVYVLDWGIAVALEDDGTGRFPLAKDALSLAGTPAYMAPEMLGGPHPRIGPWTDVYLLGAMLYEAISGEPPHRGEEFAELLESIVTGPPALDGAPEELWSICQRAMSLEPSHRYESADAFRLALEEYLEHRGAIRLGERAAESRRAMDRALEAGERDAADAAFAECRFGYRAALEAWPRFEGARKRLRDAELRMARAELAAGRPEAAQRLLLAGDTAPQRLVQEVADAMAVKRLEAASVARWRDDEDSNTGRRTRSFVLGVVCSLWCIGPLLRPYYQSESFFGRVAPQVFPVLAVAALLYYARDSMNRSRMNRAVAGILAASVVTIAMVSLVAVAAGLEQLWIYQVIPFVALAGILSGTALVHLRLAPAALAMSVTCFVSVLRPEWCDVATSAAGVVLLINVLYLNWSVRGPTKRGSEAPNAG